MAKVKYKKGDIFGFKGHDSEYQVIRVINHPTGLTYFDFKCLKHTQYPDYVGEVYYSESLRGADCYLIKPAETGHKLTKVFK